MIRPLLLALALAVGSVAAQDTHAGPAAAPDQHTAPAKPAADAPTDIITPHITDGSHLELPWFAPPFYKEVTLPHWEPLHLGPVTLDLSPTKHVVFMLLAATLTAVLLIGSARAITRAQAEGRPARGVAGAVEAVVLYLRNEVYLPNLGHGKEAERYVPFCLALFFFILSCNLLGLLPWGATATGNISVTATLAILTFLTVEVAGMRALGAGYLNTVVYWPHDMPVYMKLPLSVILTPVELLGKFTKPFALAIRLFANMTAGHIVLLALIGLIFSFGSWALAPAPAAMGVAVMFLELFVAFLQAFIFSLLAAVFIGQIREAHH